MLRSIFTIALILFAFQGLSMAAKSASRMEKLKNRVWPDKEIPLQFSLTFPYDLRHMVNDAIDVLNELTCVKFRDAKQGDKYHIKIQHLKETCSARMGIPQEGDDGYTILNLHPACFYEGLATTIHELIHTVGINHEQTRADRDYYVMVHDDRIKADVLYNFKKQSGSDNYLASYGLPYDYNSVMHYADWAFNNGNGAVMTLNSNYSGRMGQSSGPSRTDIAHVNRMYKCWDHYLGDDIPGALPYKEFHDAFLAPNPTMTPAVKEWEKDIKQKIEEGQKIVAAKNKQKRQQKREEIRQLRK